MKRHTYDLVRICNNDEEIILSKVEIIAERSMGKTK